MLPTPWKHIQSCQPGGRWGGGERGERKARPLPDPSGHVVRVLLEASRLEMGMKGEKTG